MAPPVAIILALSLYVVTWIIVQVIYNIYWHALSRFPGPWLYATSRVPYVLSAITGNLSMKLHELHEVYGPVVRTASNELSFIEPSAWKTIYGQSESGYTNYKKNYDTFNETRNQIGQSIFIAGDEDHKRMRKILNYAFSPHSLQQLEPLLLENASELLQGLELERVKNNGVVDLVKWYNWAAFDTIADASFAESFRCLRETEYRYWPISLSKTWKKITYASGLKNIMPLTLLMPVISLIQWILPGSMLQKEVNKLDLVMNRVKKHVDLKQANGKDISSSLIKLNGEKHVLSEAELISNLSLFVFAGTETVATLLPAATYLLTQNIQAMRKLTDAIRIAFPDEQSITVLGLGQIPYLTACINEALRLFPPIPEGLPRVVPPRGDVISGELVPGGTFVQISHFAANRSTANFTEPESFIPERWLGTDERFARDKLQASQPFSVGPRDCIGQTLAMSEVRLIIGRVLWRYDLRSAVQGDWTEQSAYLLWEKKPLPVELIPVRSAC